jgi:hypothetical protein
MRTLLALGFLMTSSVLATAQDDVAIDCAAFQKQPDGAYRVIAPTIVKMGTSTFIFSSSVIPPDGKIGNAEVYAALDGKCADSTATIGQPAIATPVLPRSRPN